MSKTIRVAQVVNEEELVLNIGETDRVQLGDRYLVYGIGEEIIDPDTKQSLGKLEIVKGTGTVIHVQEKMCTIRTDMKLPRKAQRKKITSSPNPLFSSIATYNGRVEEIEYMDPPEEKPFNAPQQGDFAKLIR